MATRKKAVVEPKVTKIKKISGLKEDGTPNAFWQKFKCKLALYDSDDISKWQEYHFLGHILKRYKDYMGIEFTLSYSRGPTQCPEMFCIKRMIAFLGVGDNKTIKDYIDFVFDQYIIPRKVPVTSIGYFFTTEFIFQFKKRFSKAARITRSTQLPTDYKSVVNSLSLDVCTYGDLAFAKLAIENDPNSSEIAIYIKMFDELKNIGFDDGVLGRLDGN
jgi:predicted acetyltransferase